MTSPTLTESARKCASFSKNLATLTPLSPQANIVPKKYRSRNRTSKVTERRNQRNSIHHHLPSTKPCCHAVKNVILKKFKVLRNDPETKHIFPLPPLILFKRDKNIGNFLVRSSFKSDNQLGSFKCTRTLCKTGPFIYNMIKISGPNRSVKITDHFTCISANVIYCIT